MSNVDAFANSIEPQIAAGLHVPEPDEPAGGTFPTDTGRRAASHDEDTTDDVPTREGIAGHIEERGGDDPDQVGDVPAGGAGADSGAGGAVQVDPSSSADVPDESTHNDEPGVGTRRSESARPSTTPEI